MSITEILLKAASNLAANVLEKKVLSKDAKKTAYQDVPTKISSHLKYIANWSGRIQFYGLGTAIDTDKESIPLNYHGTPRKFRGENNLSEIKDEFTLLRDSNNYLLLGDPGAGKTTSLKRITRKLLCDFPCDHTDIYQYPILIRLKELHLYKTICFSIADVLGFKIEEKEHIKIFKKEIVEEDEYGNEEKKIVEEKTVTYSSVIDDVPVDDFIPKFIDESNAILLIDGLDELDTSFTEQIREDLQKLALKLSTSKVILTCRSGYYYSSKTIEGFNLLELLPLENEQITSLASLWLDDVDKFLIDLHSLPYKDLSDRPLLLSQLLFIYKRYGNLPKHPKEVYQLIIELLLKEWDADRQVVRKSKYSDFNAKRKSEFLAELSYRLMYKNRKMQFKGEDLINIYRNIYYKYDLPYDEASEVAAEIETHTGLIVSAGYREYEFSHLSLQEYLCADYIVRSPMTMEIKDLLEINPEPVAIAIALASDATSWLNNLIIENNIFDVLKVRMPAFLKRITIEKPIFRIDVILGFSILNVFFGHFATADNHLKKLYIDFFSIKGIKASVRLLSQENKSIKISRVKKDSEYITISYPLSQKSISGSQYTKSIVTKMSDLKEFFDIFDIKFTPENIRIKKQNVAKYKSIDLMEEDFFE